MQKCSGSSRQDFICDNNLFDHLLIVFPGKSVSLSSLAVDVHCFSCKEFLEYCAFLFGRNHLPAVTGKLHQSRQIAETEALKT
jgi:hypothetical protein